MQLNKKATAIKYKVIKVRGQTNFTNVLSIEKALQSISYGYKVGY